jgi:hypothetical protein
MRSLAQTPYNREQEAARRQVTIWCCKCNMKMLTRYFAANGEETLLVDDSPLIIPSGVEESLTLADGNS